MRAAPPINNRIPLETEQAAKSLFNVHHIYLQIGDHLDTIFSGVSVDLLDPYSRYDASSVSRLALASAFQMAEELSDTQTAKMTMERLDWKYALYLPVKHPGYSELDLCNFRRGLNSSSKSMDEFAALLLELKKFGLFPRSTGPLEDASTGLKRVCQISRLYALDIAIKDALGVLVSQEPEWLLMHISPHWYERYSSRRFNPGSRPSTSDLLLEAARFGIDIQHLLTSITQEGADHLSKIPEIKTLQQLFTSQFNLDDGAVRWHPVDCASCTLYSSFNRSRAID